MKPYHRLNLVGLLIVLALSLAAGPAARAQQMPQDNWTSHGLQFGDPANPNASFRSIAIGSGGVYVGEVVGQPYNATQILQFTQGGVFVSRFSTAFTNIVGIACDSAGNVYVLDAGNSTVTKLDPNGTLIQQWGSSGSGNGQFNLVSQYTIDSMITVDKNSQIYVCDPGNTRVVVFDSNGNFLRNWGQAGSLPSQFSTGAPTSIAANPNGEIYVGSLTSSISGLLAVFGPDGTYHRSAGSITASGGDNWSWGLTPDGLIIHYYWNASSTLVRDMSLTYITSIPALYGTQAGLAVNNRGDLYVVAANVVQVYQREYSNVPNSLLPPAIPQPIVLDDAQRTGTAWLDIDYQVTDADSPTVSTGALAFINGNNTLTDAVVMSTFMEGTSGNIGANIATGVPLHLTWNMAADWSVDFAQTQVEILANDGRSLLGVHWITVPATGNLPAVQVSANSVSDTVLLDVWYWLIATHYPGMSFANGVITGSGGAYDGQVLASGVSTTAAGRAFIYGVLGVSAITTDQITQATAGNYGFTSVDTNSVVKAVTP